MSVRFTNGHLQHGNGEGAECSVLMSAEAVQDHVHVTGRATCDFKASTILTSTRTSCNPWRQAQSLPNHKHPVMSSQRSRPQAQSLYVLRPPLALVVLLIGLHIGFLKNNGLGACRVSSPLYSPMESPGGYSLALIVRLMCRHCRV